MPKLWFLLGLTACDVGPIELDSHAPSAVLYDDGTALRVTGCSDGQLLGCGAPGDGATMTVTTGGVAHPVPTTDADTEVGAIPDQLLGAFRDGPFRLTLPRPLDAQVGLVLAGVSSHVTLAPSFAVTAPAHVVRSAGPVAIAFDALTGATATALVLSTCGSRTHVDLAEPTAPGTLALALPDDAGPCTHEVHVDQTLELASDVLTVQTVRISVVTVTSEP